MPRRKQSRKRNKKGTVAIGDLKGMLRLRWTFEGKPYCLAIGLPNTPINRHAAQAKAAEIQEDIALRRFDTSLDKYRPDKDELPPTQISTAEVFVQFTEYRRQSGTSGQAISTRYNSLLSNLRQFGRDIETQLDAEEFVELLRLRQCPLVSNQNLSLLKGFADWAVTNDLIELNPFAGIQRLRASMGKNPKRRALKKEEIRAFLDAIKSDRYYYHYHDFCMTMQGKRKKNRPNLC